MRTLSLFLYSLNTIYVLNVSKIIEYIIIPYIFPSNITILNILNEL